MLHHLLQAPVNSFEFQPCDRTPQAECLWRQLKKSNIIYTKIQHSEFTVQTTRVSNLVCYLHFRPSTSVFTKKSPSLLIFLHVFAVVAPRREIPLFCKKLQSNSIRSFSKIEFQALTTNLLNRLRTLYAQLFQITLAPPVLPRLLARELAGTKTSFNNVIIILNERTLQLKAVIIFKKITIFLYIIHIILLDQTFVHCPIFLTAG